VEVRLAQISTNTGTTKAGTRNLVVGGSMAALFASITALIAIPMTVRDTLSSRFLPHAYCYLYDKKLIALHVGSDGVIWLSYVSIALTLAYLVWRTRREMPFSWMFLAFGTFIIACGFTHFMEIVVLWKPLYWLAGDIKLVTALASVVTAIALPPLIPQVQSMIQSADLSEELRLRLEQANRELHNLSGRLLRAQDGERRRIARELHDGVGQYLAAMKMSFDLASSEEEDSEAVRESLVDCQDLLERCTMEIRTMSHLLHPPLLEEMGLAAAARWYVEGFIERSGITVDLEIPDQFDRLPRPTEMVLFRVLQESLTNIHRHSGSKLATIRLMVDGGNAVLTVQDQGKGFAERLEQPTRMGVGIAGMRERVQELGGEFNIESTARGATVTAVLPLEEESSNVTAHSDRG
jgi:signal transduction histidine kinase